MPCNLSPNPYALSGEASSSIFVPYADSGFRYSLSNHKFKTSSLRILHGKAFRIFCFTVPIARCRPYAGRTCKPIISPESFPSPASFPIPERWPYSFGPSSEAGILKLDACRSPEYAEPTTGGRSLLDTLVSDLTRSGRADSGSDAGLARTAHPVPMGTEYLQNTFILQRHVTRRTP